MIAQDFIGELNTFNDCLRKLNTITNELPDQLQKFFPCKEKEAEQVEQFLESAREHMLEVGRGSTAEEDARRPDNKTSNWQIEGKLLKSLKTLANKSSETCNLINASIKLVDDEDFQISSGILQIALDKCREVTSTIDLIPSLIPQCRHSKQICKHSSVKSTQSN